MSVEIGGRAGKLGDTYERRWAIKFALMLLVGTVKSLRWEPLGEGAEGVDLELVFKDDHREGHQLKRQNGSDGKWTIADLDREGVLRSAFALLQLDSTSRFVFVSSDPAVHLKDLTDRAPRDPASLEVFLSEHVGSKLDRKKAYEDLVRRWGLDPATSDDNGTAFGLIKRMACRVVDRSDDFKQDLLLLAGNQLTGDPEAAVAVIGQYLDDHVGKPIFADALLKHLLDKAHSPRDLASVPSLASACRSAADRFQSSLQSRLIGGVMLSRPEVGSLVRRIDGPTPPKVVFVHGRAGCGKSAFLLDLVRQLPGTIPCLPVQLHAYTPEHSPFHYGTTVLELPGSPTHSLLALAAGRQSVLILDQLDALRLTSTHSHAAWEACIRIIEEALACPNITVLLACRTFDLENDPNIHKWQEAIRQRFATGAETVQLGNLSEETAGLVTKAVGVELGSLSGRVRNMLCHPNTLGLWRGLATGGQVFREFATATELMRQFIRARRAEAVAERGTTESDVQTVMDALIERMDSTGRLTVPEAVVGTYSQSIAALCSVGLLVREHNAISFVHQSYFDHLVAERVIRQAGATVASLIAWVKLNQSLFRRDQLRHLLFLLRDSDSVTYTGLLRGLLTDPDVRFHLKHLALGILREADSPSDAEIAFVIELARSDHWWEQLWSRVFWMRTPWFDALAKRGTWREWLSSFDKARIGQCLRLLGTYAAERGKEVDAAIGDYWDAGGEWETHLEQVVAWDPGDDSPRMAELRRRNIASGKWQMHDVYLDHVAARHPERVVSLLEAMIRRALHRVLASPSEPGPLWQIRDEVLEKSVFAAVRQHGEQGWNTFGRLLTTLIRMDRWQQSRIRSHEDLDQSYFRIHSVVHHSTSMLESLIRESVAGIANSAPDLVPPILTHCDRIAARALNRAVASGLIDAPQTLSSEIIRWICRDPSRLSLGDGHDVVEWTPARELIQSHSLKCDDTAFLALEETILAYFPDRERRSFEYQKERLERGSFDYTNGWGRSQNVLLSALAPSRMRPKAKDRAATWRAKFGDPATERPLSEEGSGGWVRSTIPVDRLRFVSDAQWVQIVNREWSPRGSGRWTQLDADTVGERSHEHFASDLGEVAKRTPRRFAALGLRFPPNAHADYYSRLLEALSSATRPDGGAEWEPASTDALAALILHVTSNDDTEFARTVCRVIERRASDPWPEGIMDLLARFAKHSDPQPDTFSCLSNDSSADGGMRPDIAMTAINCVRGCTAGVIRTLLFHHWHLWERLRPMALALLSDSHAAVRHEALGIALPVLNHDRDKALALFTAACDHPDPRVLESQWVNRMLRYARSTHLEALEPLVRRMVSSEANAVAQNGAAWATALHLSHKRLSEVTTQCRNGSRHHRLGVANAAQQLFQVDKSWAEASDFLADLFDDDDEEVRGMAARVFRHDGALAFGGTPALALRLVNSRAFAANADDLILPLSEYTGDIRPLADVVLGAASRLSGDLAEETRSLQRTLGLAGREMSALLLRLYETGHNSNNRSLVESCLDRWDAMLASRVGETERHLESLDS